jgi:threonine/homoserine/homoserine lactone efflux protein
MSTLPALLSFVLAASLLTVTPGPDSGLVLRTSVAEGSRQGCLASLGIIVGLGFWGMAVALGLAALLAASPRAFQLLQWAGAAYLVWFGLDLLLRPRTELATISTGWGRAFLRGLIQNLLNAKIGIFYLSFLPQFLPAEGERFAWTLLLAGVHIALTTVWFLILVVATRPVIEILRRPTFLKTLDRLTGGVFFLSGAKLGLSHL